MPTAPTPEEVLEHLLRQRWFRLLLAEDAAAEKVVENLPTRRHRGLGARVGRPVGGPDGRALELPALPGGHFSRYGGSRASTVKQCLPGEWFQNTSTSDSRARENVAHTS